MPCHPKTPMSWPARCKGAPGHIWNEAACSRLHPYPLFLSPKEKNNLENRCKAGELSLLYACSFSHTIIIIMLHNYILHLSAVHFSQSYECLIKQASPLALGAGRHSDDICSHEAFRELQGHTIVGKACPAERCRSSFSFSCASLLKVLCSLQERPHSASLVKYLSCQTAPTECSLACWDSEAPWSTLAMCNIEGAFPI